MSDDLSYFPPHTKLPMAVLIPTYNCAERLRIHVRELRDLFSMAAEIVAVDSYSTDGSYELLRKELKHPNVRIYQRPPGLYECWNFGIEQIRSPITYISTVGDAINRDGLALLCGMLESTDSGVVTSAPAFVSEAGQRVRKQWPIHMLAKPGNEGFVKPGGFANSSFYELDPWQAFLISILEAPQNTIGSAAANVYRTEALIRHPFPADYGHFGDTAWIIQNAFDIRIAVFRHTVSHFTLHESGACMDKEKLEEIRDRLFALAVKTLPRAAASENPPDLERLVPLLKSFPSAFGKMRALEQTYSRVRSAHPAWIFSPQAWLARARRNRQRSAVRGMKTRLLALASERTAKKPSA